MDLIAVCICHVALHLVFHNCSDLPSHVSIEFSKLAENSSTYRVFNVSSPLTESSSKLSLSLQSLSSCDCINRCFQTVCFPSLIRSVGTQISRRRFVTEGFICSLKSHVLCPVPSISSTISNQSLTYMPSMTQCQEIVRLSDIEQLCENVTHAEKHTPDDKEHLHLRIHQDVLNPRSITMYSTFLPLPSHRLLLQVVIGHVTLSHRSLSSPVLHLQLMTCLPLCSG